jgi:hypothetical protein
VKFLVASRVGDAFLFQRNETRTKQTQPNATYQEKNDYQNQTFW